MKRTLVLLAAAMVVMDAAPGLVFGLLPQIQQRGGFSTAELGLVSGSGFAAMVFGLLTLSHFADRGHSRLMVLAGLAGVAAGLFGFGFATSLPAMVLSRVVLGLAAAVYTAAARAFAATIDPASAGRNLGILTSAEIIGFISGPVLGTTLKQLGNISTPFYALGSLALAIAAIFVIRFPTIHSEAIPHPTSWTRTVGLDLLSNKRIRAATLMGLAVYLPIGVFDSVWSIYLTDLGASETFIGLSLSLYGIPLALLAGAGGKICDRSGPVRSASRAIWVIAPVIVLYGVFRTPWVICAFSIIDAAFEAIATPGCQLAIARSCPSERMASGQGLGAVFGLAGSALLASAAPAVYAAVGAFPLFTGLAVICLCIAMLAARLHGPDVEPVHHVFTERPAR